MVISYGDDDDEGGQEVILVYTLEVNKLYLRWWLAMVQ